MKPPYNEHQQLSSQQERREAKPATRPASGEPCPAPGTWLARLRCPPAPTERKPVLSLFRLQNRRPTLRPSSSVQQKLSLRFHQKGVRSLRVDILLFCCPKHHHGTNRRKRFHEKTERRPSNSRQALEAKGRRCWSGGGQAPCGGRTQHSNTGVTSRGPVTTCVLLTVTGLSLVTLVISPRSQHGGRARCGGFRGCPGGGEASLPPPC